MELFKDILYVHLYKLQTLKLILYYTNKLLFLKSYKMRVTIPSYEKIDSANESYTVRKYGEDLMIMNRIITIIVNNIKV